MNAQVNAPKPSNVNPMITREHNENAERKMSEIIF